MNSIEIEMKHLYHHAGIPCLQQAAERVKLPESADNLYKFGIKVGDMPFFLDTQEVSQRFDKYVTEFCALLDTNHVRHGSPQDLFEFADALDRSNQFRNDLSALVKSVVKREPDEILLTDMMSIVAAAVGGPSFAETNLDITRPTNTLMEFLLGTGLWKHFGSPPPPAPREATPHRPAVHVEEPRPIPVSSPPPPAVPIVSENPEVRSTLIEASSELRQTLTRLEINTLQVKLHLESIEQRISKIEPLPEAPHSPPSAEQVSSEPSPQPEHRLQPLAAAAVEPVPVKVEPSAQPIVAAERVPIAEPVPVRSRSTPAFVPPIAPMPVAAETAPPTETVLPARGRALFSHEPIPEPAETDDFEAPTFAFAAEKGRSIVPVILIIVFLLVAVGAWFYFARARRGQAISTTPPADTSFSATGAPAIPAPANSTPANSATSANTGTSHPPASEAAPDDSADNTDVHYVEPNVMEGNLLSAPRPIYPPSARASHVQGKVALRATISRGGSILTLHVISGPQPLRAAAVDAVRNWRYKPYTVNGRPVDVSTIVYVNFSLAPPPQIAH